MTLNDKILFYLIENPRATNDEVATSCGIQENHAKVTISKLKAKGVIEVSGQGDKRSISVLKEPTVKLDKRERYNRQLDFLEEIMFSDVDPKYRLDASAQHIRLLNKL
ncbi:winged helix-turn-helix domain-containing protein [Listeria monocytogenes]|uniref:winged helix-turn-helix domain-containing protein n=1 Tax=Listeria monocytogenes TaxID=1639 RepID=UPI00085C2008|nr:winged helix-turn-helix domain-containing protein [Listeria monocytogenes]EAG6333243.1 winged helix-turn-helix domain-containing protein [Listeria monocytogenes CFSAN002346]EAG6373379.1 winged helix-turn-helix domain-containing protein [Listeria monocytogenes CFSAN002356]EAC3152228.1 winged helix-turn-helix domain-containing protein [Listeria monocytogenes]EAC5866399.1 winged helix-turn-helix domain-containing protein [Listeria monocytogenes]EAC8117253.1 winged helix-turn-helix domain-conta